jgi:DNA-binding HxlR family transcriptional regulator
MAALDLLGRRWALRILWELRAGPLGFREIQHRCDAMSSSVLRDRLEELLDARLIARAEGDRYALSAQGHSLGRAIEPMKAWADGWARSLGAASTSGGAGGSKEPARTRGR